MSSPLTVPGSLHPSNKSLSWNDKGLLAYGSHCTLIVVDCMRRKRIQTLEKHSTAICLVSWAPEKEFGGVCEPQLRLASSDVGGNVIVWNVLEGTDIATFRHQNSVPSTLVWFPYEDTNRDFLLVLHSQSTLILWNTVTGLPIWNVTYEPALTSFSLDTFDLRNITFSQTDGKLLTVNDLMLHKAPCKPGITLSVFTVPGTITELCYHFAYPNLLFAATEEEIVCVEMECRCVVWRQQLETPVLSLMCCAERDAIFTVHSSGLLVLRVCKISVDEKYVSHLSYERVLGTETPRQSAHYRIVSAALCPVTQSTIAVIYNSGHISFYQLCLDECNGIPPYRTTFITDALEMNSELECRPAATLRFPHVGEMFSIGQGACVVRMRPMNDPSVEEHARHLVAIGNNQGVVAIVNIFDSTVLKEFQLYSCPVRCLEWGGPRKIISVGYSQTLSASSLVRNDVFITDIFTGSVRRLREEVEESPIEIIRVSFYCCYLAIAFRNEPLEIWHLQTRSLMRRMSRACPIIVDMAWSGKQHTAKTVIPTRSEASGESRVARNEEEEESVFRENLVVLDRECHLYHVVIKGLHVRDGKEWKFGAYSMKSLVWKDDLIVMCEATGRLGVWDLERHLCRQTGEPSHGPILRMIFSKLNGDHTLAVLHSQSIVLWDCDQLNALQQCTLGGELTLLDMDLCGICPMVLCSDNSYRYITSERLNDPIHPRCMPLLLTANFADTSPGVVETDGRKLALLNKFLKATVRLTSKRMTDGERGMVSPVNGCHANGQICERDSDAESAGAAVDGVAAGTEGAAECRFDEEINEAMLPKVLRSEGAQPVKRKGKKMSRYSSECPDEESLSETDKKSEAAASDFQNKRPQRRDDWSWASFGFPRSWVEESDSEPTVFQRLQEWSGKDSLAYCKAMHRFVGNRWLYDLWSLIDNRLNGSLLTPNLFMFWPSDLFKRRATGMLSCMVNLQGLSSEQIDDLVHRAIVLNVRDLAMQMLLRDECRTSALRACLLASDVSSEGAQSIVKLVATNLIANYCIADGVQMLFLIGHGDDACRYLQAHGLWLWSLYFAKMGLENHSDVCMRWVDQLCASNCQKSLCCMLTGSVNEWERLLQLLVAGGKTHVAENLRDELLSRGNQLQASVLQIIANKANP